MSRPRRHKDKHLPANLYCNNGYFSYRNPISKKYSGLGRNRYAAITHANLCNRDLLTSSVANRMHIATKDLLSKEVIVSAAMSRRNVAGIYFLVRGDEIVYVGQSLNVHARIAAHIVQRKKAFDGYHFVPCDPALLLQTEASYILAFRPKYNLEIPQVLPGANYAQSPYSTAGNF